MGLTRADLVAVIVADAAEFLTALFGASMAGVVPASLYPPATTTELRQYLRATAGILQSARAAGELESGWLSSMVLAAGAVGCVLGGKLTDWLMKRTGNAWQSRCARSGRRTVRTSSNPRNQK